MSSLMYTRPSQRTKQQFRLFSDEKDYHAKRKQASDFHYNVGVGIRTLVDDLPDFFHVGLTNTQIYDDQIRFHDPRHFHVSFAGKRYYCATASVLRYALNSWFTDIEFDIVKVKQYRGGRDEFPMDNGDSGGMSERSDIAPFSDVESSLPCTPPILLPAYLDPGQRSNRTSISNSPLLPLNSPAPSPLSSPSPNEPSKDKGNIRESQEGSEMHLLIRWTFSGIPRLGLLNPVPVSGSSPNSSYSNSSPNSSSDVQHYTVARSLYEGAFVYKFNHHGRISEHYVQSIVPAPPLVFRIWGMMNPSIATL